MPRSRSNLPAAALRWSVEKAAQELGVSIMTFRKSIARTSATAGADGCYSTQHPKCRTQQPVCRCHAVIRWAELGLGVINPNDTGSAPREPRRDIGDAASQLDSILAGSVRADSR